MGTKGLLPASLDVVLLRMVGFALRWLGLLVPEAGGRRLQYLEKWAGANLGHYRRWLESRGQTEAEIRRALLRYARDGAAAAMEERWPDRALALAIDSRFRSPWAGLILPVAILILGLAVSGVFSPMRHAFAPLVPSSIASQGRQLVTTEASRSFFGKSLGFTARQFALVRERSRSYEAITGFALRRVAVNSTGPPLRNVAFAAPELFPLLRLPVPPPPNEGTGQALVAEELGAADWLGREIEVSGRKYLVSGVWPRHCRVSLVQPDFWIVESAGTFAERKYDTTLVALLKPGVTADAATAELRDILLSAPGRRSVNGSPDRVVPLTHRQDGTYRVLWIAYCVVLAALVLFACARAIRYAAATAGTEPSPAPTRRRKEIYFLAKAVPLVTGVCALATAGLDHRLAASAAGTFFVFWWTGIFAALGIWWALRDQATRCPQCLTRMTLAVQIGSHGNPLLEGVGDELICEYGHGALWLPGAPAQAFGPEVWRSE